MITLETQISGGQMAAKMCDEPEELCYFFYGLIEDAVDDLPRAMKDYMNDTEQREVAEFLRFLADQIEAE